MDPASQWPDPDMILRSSCPDLARPAAPPRRSLLLYPASKPRGEITVLVKVFPIKLKDGMQDTVEAIVQEFAPKGPGTEDGTLSFRVYRDPAKPDYLLFVEHFTDQAAYDAHTSSPAYRDLIAGQFADKIVEFTEIDHKLVVAL
jgi:quinol monooxygenase YgiN